MAQEEKEPGVLILSEFAGAAEQLTDALIVNPHDAQGVADAINRALLMPIEERRERWTKLKKIVETENVAWWREQFLADLEKVNP